MIILTVSSSLTLARLKVDDKVSTVSENSCPRSLGRDDVSDESLGEYGDLPQRRERDYLVSSVAHDPSLHFVTALRDSEERSIRERNQLSSPSISVKGSL